MLVEKWPNRHNFPKFTSNDQTPPGPKRFTTTLKHFRGWRGQFAYEDHEAPWSVVARDLDISIGNRPRYHGTATFTGGTVAIQDDVPFYANMKARFVLDGAHVHLDRIDLDTDGARTLATGDVELGSKWPEQTYRFQSHVRFPRMRQIFFKDEKWQVAGDGDCDGTFHLFKGGHDLACTFASAMIGVNEYRFPALHGALRWTPTAFLVTSAGAKLFGGDGRFTYSIQPLRSAGRPRARSRGEFPRRRPDLVHRLPAAARAPLRGCRGGRGRVAGMAAGAVRRPPGRRTPGGLAGRRATGDGSVAALRAADRDRTLPHRR